MRARALVHRSVSSVCMLSVAVLLASCKLNPTYRVGGLVSGLTGTGLVLQNNSGDDLTISSNGPFTFSTALKKGKPYNVTVRSQPPGHNCTVENGNGTITRNVNDIRVNCVSGGFTVGGMVSGLAGAGLVLQNNGGDNLPVGADGVFTFSTPLVGGTAYDVTAFAQPSGQTCTVSNGRGSIAGTNVTNVAVDCVANTFTVGGSVSGLTGAGLVLQNNGSDDLPISGDGSFAFSAALTDGSRYGVTVATQPSGQGCSVTNGSGIVSGANVTNVIVACVAPPPAPTPSLGFSVKELRFTWPAASGAAYYRLLENPDGASGFSEVATGITALNYNHTIPVHRRLNAKYVLEACNAGGCTPSFSVDLGTNLAQAIGYVKASNSGTGDQFGLAIALSGDGGTLAVGAPNEDSNRTGVTAGAVNEADSGNAAPESGAVYVFARVGGAWLQQAYIKASNAGAGDAFGISVALSGDGDTLAVGARSDDGAALDSGAVYIFTRTAGAWSQQAYVKASNHGASDLFGSAVALSGDGNTLAVGAAFEDSAGIGGNQTDDCGVVTPANCALNSGAVYVYTRSAGAWSQQAYVKASNTEGSDVFGSAVALNGDGNTLAVGAPREGSSRTGVTSGMVDELASGNGALRSGAVYVYTRMAGTWSQQAYVKASNTQSSDAFGSSVALAGDGDTLAVGAPQEDGNATGVGGGSNELASNSGAAYVYARSGSTWSFQAYVKASNTGAGDQFGTSVALSADGSSLAVGAPFEDGSFSGIESPSDESAPDAGAVYVYVRSAGTWSLQAYVKTSSNAGDPDRFGTSVALDNSGNTLAVGAQLEDGSATGIGGTQDNLAIDSGGVYLY